MSSTGTVLIVEVERNMRRVLSALLERVGSRVLAAPKGARDLEQADPQNTMLGAG